MAGSTLHVVVRPKPLEGNQNELTHPLIYNKNSSISSNSNEFAFDHVFQPDATNEEVYNVAVDEKLQRLFEGYNATILAYGQTGSGKTYTMGTNYNKNECSSYSDVGIIPRTIDKFFDIMESKKQSARCSAKMSFFEIYTEQIYDLLNDSSSELTIKEGPDGIKVNNLTEVPVQSVQDAFDILRIGSNARHTAATAGNITSSRSHAIFCIYLEQTDRVTFRSIKGKLLLVDLAGSERASVTKITDIQMKEGIKVNQGLLSLGKVITQLRRRSSHVPYRDSKLTRILQDSIGGNSYTTMIACIDPNPKSLKETLRTLRSATIANRIINKPVINMDSLADHIKKLKNKLLELESAQCNRCSSVDFEYFSKLAETNENLRNEIETSRLENSFLTQQLHEFSELESTPCRTCSRIDIEDLSNIENDHLKCQLEDSRLENAQLSQKLAEAAGLYNNIVEQIKTISSRPKQKWSECTIELVLMLFNMTSWEEKEEVPSVDDKENRQPEKMKKSVVQGQQTSKAQAGFTDLQHKLEHTLSTEQCLQEKLNLLEKREENVVVNLKSSTKELKNSILSLDAVLLKKTSQFNELHQLLLASKKDLEVQGQQTSIAKAELKDLQHKLEQALAREQCFQEKLSMSEKQKETFLMNLKSNNEELKKNIQSLDALLVEKTSQITELRQLLLVSKADLEVQGQQTSKAQSELTDLRHKLKQTLAREQCLQEKVNVLEKQKADFVVNLKLNNEELIKKIQSLDALLDERTIN